MKFTAFMRSNVLQGCFKFGVCRCTNHSFIGPNPRGVRKIQLSAPPSAETSGRIQQKLGGWKKGLGTLYAHGTFGGDRSARASVRMKRRVFFLSVCVSRTHFPSPVVPSFTFLSIDSPHRVTSSVRTGVAY